MCHPGLYWSTPSLPNSPNGAISSVPKAGGLPALIDTWDEDGWFGVELAVGADGLDVGALRTPQAPAPSSTAPGVPEIAGKVAKIPR